MQLRKVTGNSWRKNSRHEFFWKGLPIPAHKSLGSISDSDVFALYGSAHEADALGRAAALLAAISHDQYSMQIIPMAIKVGDVTDQPKRQRYSAQENAIDEIRGGGYFAEVCRSPRMAKACGLVKLSLGVVTSKCFSVFSVKLEGKQSILGTLALDRGR